MGSRNSSKTKAPTHRAADQRASSEHFVHLPLLVFHLLQSAFQLLGLLKDGGEAVAFTDFTDLLVVSNYAP